MLKAIFIDMDDTLIVNQVLYQTAKDKFCGYMRHYGVRDAELLDVFERVEKEHFPVYGYSRARYPASFEKTLKTFIPDADADTVATVRDFAEEVFRTVARVKPDVPEALDILTSIAPVYIVTAGPDSVQQFRIDNLPFKDKFAGFHIVPKKDKDVFEGILAQYNLKPEETVMIGDSLKSDVFSAAAAGMNAVWVEAHNAFFEAVNDDLPALAVKRGSLIEAARVLRAETLPQKTAKPVANCKLPPRRAP